MSTDNNADTRELAECARCKSCLSSLEHRHDGKTYCAVCAPDGAVRVAVNGYQDAAWCVRCRTAHVATVSGGRGQVCWSCWDEVKP